MDPHRRPTQPHPLLEMHQRDDGTYSDFPSFREHESTPSPPVPTREFLAPLSNTVLRGLQHGVVPHRA